MLTSSEYQKQPPNTNNEAAEARHQQREAQYQTANFVLGLSCKSLERGLADGRAQQTRLTPRTAAGYEAREITGQWAVYQKADRPESMWMRLRWLRQCGVNRQSQPYESNGLTLEAAQPDGQVIEIGQIQNSHGSLTNDNILTLKEDGSLLSIPPDCEEAASLYEAMLDVGHRMQVAYDHKAGQNLARAA